MPALVSFLFISLMSMRVSFCPSLLFLRYIFYTSLIMFHVSLACRVQVIWEPLIFAGDDLRIVSTLIFLLRMIQIAMIIYIIHHIIRFNHNPDYFLQTGCLGNVDNYWAWYYSSLAGCFFVLIYGFIGAFIEIA